MRAQPGSEWTLFDGFGSEYRARLRTVARRTAELEVLECLHVNRESPSELHIAVALPKGDRQKWLIEKSVELGVRSLTPLQAARSVVAPSAVALEKLRRQVIEASKQCGRNVLMDIQPPQKYDELIMHVSHSPRWIADPQGPPLGQFSRPLDSPATIVIGPEGGFTDEELRLATGQGWDFVSLGPRMLRIETAALALSAWFVCRG
jgi:16S rRNA (uracil1498-N3)-methyltransferase